jgi:predicted CxxxxCH...CXXCH cytochrome family protein
VPANVADAGHIDGTVEVSFTGMATLGGAAPTWNPQSRRCAGTYCHLATTPSWDSSESLTCAGCHGAPPPSHSRYGPETGTSQCARCHPAQSEEKHLDGQVDVLPLACNACHGKGSFGAPPPALDGSTSPTTRGVGAHGRHLDSTLADRIGKVARCPDCHVVPKTFDAPGHIDEGPPADVSLAFGSYDAEATSCVTGCHFDREPGPVWTDTSGAARACDACHGFPPLETRQGTPHPSVAPDASACTTCHTFDPATHVDGHVDFL